MPELKSSMTRSLIEFRFASAGGDELGSALGAPAKCAPTEPVLEAPPHRRDESREHSDDSGSILRGPDPHILSFGLGKTLWMSDHKLLLLTVNILRRISSRRNVAAFGQESGCPLMSWCLGLSLRG